MYWGEFVVKSLLCVVFGLIVDCVCVVFLWCFVVI